MITLFEADNVSIKKAKPYGILMPKDTVGELYCCIPLVQGMDVDMKGLKGRVSGEYELLYREVLPRNGAGVIRLPRQYMSCDVLLIK